MRRLFISDLHLDEVDSPRFRAFTRLLDAAARRTDALYVLGDLCEVWVGDDDDAPLATALHDAIAHASRHLDVYFLPGNRDFLLGESFARGCGMRILDDPHFIEPHCVLTHGDQFCTDDEAYQRTRQTLRSSAWQAEILQRSLVERRALAQSLRQQSISTNANKPSNIMDVNATAVAQAMDAWSARRLIHGHTHRPGVHQEPWGMRYVLGSWDRCGWLLRQQGDEEPELNCVGLASRYEI